MPHSRIAPTDVKVEGVSKLYDLSNFDCEDKDLNEFLKQDSFKYKNQLIAKTFIVIYEEQVVAFFSVMNDAIKLKLEETEETPRLKRLREYPALKVGRLGVDKKFQRRGLGNIIIDLTLSWHLIPFPNLKVLYMICQCIPTANQPSPLQCRQGMLCAVRRGTLPFHRGKPPSPTQPFPHPPNRTRQIPG